MLIYCIENKYYQMNKRITVKNIETPNSIDEFLANSGEIEYSKLLVPSKEQKSYKELFDQLDSCFIDGEFSEFQNALTLIVNTIYSDTDLMQSSDLESKILDLVSSQMQASIVMQPADLNKITNSILKNLQNFSKIKSIESSNAKELLANFLRSQNVRALAPFFRTVLKESRLRSKIMSNASYKKLVKDGTFKEGDSFEFNDLLVTDVGELHKTLEPLFAMMIKDDELRYYLNTFIDQAVYTRTKAVIEKAEKGDFYVPAINIGVGVYGQVICNELMHAAPEQAWNGVLHLDANTWMGGQFAVGNQAVFKVNNRVRPQKKGSNSRPGTRDNIMPLSDHAIIDLPSVSADTYPSQNLLGASLKVNSFLNSGQTAVGCKVTKVIRNTKPAQKGRYGVVFIDTATKKTYTVYTDLITIPDGVGSQNYGFQNKFDLETRKIVAESKLALELGKQSDYYRFSDFIKVASKANGGQWRERFKKPGVVIGSGDSGIVSVQAILGYGPNPEGDTQTQFAEKISWIGQSAQTSDDWCKASRTRYVDLAREFPRETEASEKNVRPIEQTFGLNLLANDFERILSNLNLDKSENNRQSLFNYILNNGARIQEYLKKLSQLAQLVKELQLDPNNIDSIFTAITTQKTEVESLIKFIREFSQNFEFPTVKLVQKSSVNDFDLKTIFNLKNTGRNFTINDISTFIANIKAIDENYSRLSSYFKPIVEKSRSDSESSKDQKPKKQTFHRIYPIGSKKDVVLPSGQKAFRTTRMEKAKDANGDDIVKVFYFDADGQEKFVEAAWVVDCSGLQKNTDDLFSDFDITEREVELSSPKNLEDVQNLILANISKLGADLLPQTKESIITELTTKVGTTISIDLNSQNPLLKGSTVQSLEVEENDSTIYVSISVETENKQEFFYDLVINKSDRQVDVVSAGDGKADRVGKALKVLLENPEKAKCEFTKILSGRNPKAKSSLKRVPIEDPTGLSLLPIASKIQSNGIQENIYIVGASSGFAITDKERGNVPALTDVSANLASMFRYVPVTEQFVTQVMAPELINIAGASEPDRFKEKLIIEAAQSKVQRSLDSEVDDTTLSKFYAAKDILALPKVADPEIMASVVLGDILDSYEKRSNSYLQALPKMLKAGISRLSILKNDTVDPAVAPVENMELEAEINKLEDQIKRYKAEIKSLYNFQNYDFEIIVIKEGNGFRVSLNEDLLPNRPMFKELLSKAINNPTFASAMVAVSNYGQSSKISVISKKGKIKYL